MYLVWLSGFTDWSLQNFLALWEVQVYSFHQIWKFMSYIPVIFLPIIFLRTFQHSSHVLDKMLCTRQVQLHKLSKEIQQKIFKNYKNNYFTPQTHQYFALFGVSFSHSSFSCYNFIIYVPIYLCDLLIPKYIFKFIYLYFSYQFQYNLFFIHKYFKQ